MYRRLWDARYHREYFLLYPENKTTWEAPSGNRKEVIEPPRVNTASDVPGVSMALVTGGGFEFSFCAGSIMTGAGVAEEDMEVAAGRRTSIASELKRYPPAFFKPSDSRRRPILKTVCLCVDLKCGGNKRHHVHDHITGCLYVDIKRRDELWEKRTLHHELWHGVDFSVLGARYEHEEDVEFSKHNPADFRYGSGGSQMRFRSGNTSSGSDASSPDPSCFVNLYSTASVAEDRAETWSICMTRPEVVRKQPESALAKKASVLISRARRIAQWESDPLDPSRSLHENSQPDDGPGVHGCNANAKRLVCTDDEKLSRT